VEHRRPAVAKECFQAVQVRLRRGLKYAEAECLRDRRPDSVEHGVGSSDLDPFRAAAGRDTGPGFHKARAGVRLRALQPASQGDV
jgi:hypothetical protein